MAFANAGVTIEFRGSGEQETGVIAAIDHPGCKAKVGDVVVEVDTRYYRPTEVDLLLGDATKAREKLGWVPKYNVAQLAKEMVDADMEHFRKEVLLKENGYRIFDEHQH